MLSAIYTHSHIRVSKTDKVCIIRHRCIESIGIIYGGWCVVKKRSKVSTFLKKISDNIDILSSVSNSTSPAATEMLAYFKREYYSRVWQNIDKPLPPIALMSYGEGEFLREVFYMRSKRETFLLDKKENIYQSLFCQSVLALRIYLR